MSEGDDEKPMIELIVQKKKNFFFCFLDENLTPSFVAEQYFLGWIVGWMNEAKAKAWHLDHFFGARSGLLFI